MESLIDDAAWTQNLREIVLIQDFAVRQGKTIPADLLALLQSVDQLNPEQRAQTLNGIMTRFAALVAPTTLASILDRRMQDFEKNRRNLIWVGYGGVGSLALVTILGVYVRGEWIGTEFCDTAPCGTWFAFLILCYGASLGLIGAVTYELFHASGIVRSSDYGTFDDYRSTARVVLGITFGWIFSVTISMQALARVFNIDLSGETGYDPSVTDYATILLPFLVGYSSALITGILDRLIDAIRVVFGMTSTVDPKVATPPATTPEQQPAPTLNTDSWNRRWRL